MAKDKPEGSGATAANRPGASPSGQRLGGARADFVASLGRKIAELRGVLTALEDDPDSTSSRDELRRKLHALGAGSRLLHFDRMAQAIQESEALLERASETGRVKSADVERIAKCLDDLPALAWDEERPEDVVPRATIAAAEADDDPASGPTLEPSAISVLIVGPEDLAEAMVSDGADADSTFDCERADDHRTAIPIAHAFAPDVVVLDGDVSGAGDFMQMLVDDPLMEGIPIVVVLTPGRGDSSTRFMALGAIKILARPLGADAVREACQEAIDQRDGKTMKMTLGEPPLEQLGDRLADEVRRAVVDAVDPRSRKTKVALGDGAEVWGALWGAIARVREVVTTRTAGAVQFVGKGPEGAVLAPTLMRAEGGTAASDRAAGRDRADAVDVSLKGRRVLVADDDPGVTWFISDLLRGAGCEVHEALDGRTALRMAYELSPELVVSDILMPGLDGFALCRALKRDVALRDTPVILLSWKEDLLQRVRELGASAAAYLRKESDARAIVARVREVMRPRARIAARLQGDGEVRGRLDGLTVRTLLDLVVSARTGRGARVAVRDASFLYEVELWGGGIQRASRTSGDGTFLRGDRVIPAMLGVGAGRFVVSSTRSTGTDGTPLSLAQQFHKPIALARAALHATTGSRMMNVAKVVLDEDDVNGYLLATPEPARDLVRRLARGTSPREILLRGDVSPALVEDVLSDLATRGAITAVYLADGSDALRAEAFASTAILTDVEGHGSVVPPPPRASAPPPPAYRPEPAHPDGPPPLSTPETTPAPPVPAASSEPPPIDAAAGSPVATAPQRSENPTEGASVPLSLRARAAKSPEPPAQEAGFPRALALALVAVGALIAVLGYQFWASEHARTPEPEQAPNLAPAPGVQYADLPAGFSVPDGQGLLSLTVGEGVEIRIDGNEAHLPRTGKALRTPLPKGVHLVSVGVGGSARSRILEIRAGRATNVDLDTP